MENTTRPDLLAKYRSIPHTEVMVLNWGRHPVAAPQTHAVLRYDGHYSLFSRNVNGSLTFVRNYDLNELETRFLQETKYSIG